MADIAWSDVIALAPALSVVASTWQDIIVSYVNDTLSPDIFGGEESAKYKVARVYLAAHMGLIWKKKGEVTGAVTSDDVSADAMRISYGKVDDLAKSLDLTFFGKEFQRIQGGTRARFPTTA